MEKQYSVQFFTSFVENLQDVCRNYLNFNQFVEVSGYLCVEIDNMKKERYVLSELLQSSGNVVSESFCTKSYKTSRSSSVSAGCMPSSFNQSTVSKNMRRENIDQNRRRSSAEASITSHSGLGAKRRRPSDVIEITDDQECWTDQYSPQLNEHRSGSILHKEQNAQRLSTFDKYGSVSPVVKEKLYLEANQKNATPVSATVGNPSSFEDFSAKYELDSRTQKPTSYAERIRCSQIEVPQQSTPYTDASSWNQVNDFVQAKQEPRSQDVPSFLTTDKVKIKSEVFPVRSSVVDEDDIIDLDLFEDDLDDSSLDIENEVTTPATAEDSAGRNHSSASPGSVYVVKYAVTQFQRYYWNKYGKTIDLFSLSHKHLDAVLLDFFQGVRKVSGGELSSRSLKNIQVHLDMYLRDGGYPYSIAKDDEFNTSRDFIKSKMGKYVRSQKHIPVDDQDVEMLFQRNQLGDHSPEAILNTMWFLNSKYFAIRRPMDHFNMKWGDISLKTYNNGLEYLEKAVTESFSLKVVAKPDKPSRCFVNIYKKYFFSRPQASMSNEASFYLSVNRNSGTAVWFLNEPLSWYRLSGIWRRIAAGAGLSVNKKIL